MVTGHFNKFYLMHLLANSSTSHYMYYLRSKQLQFDNCRTDCSLVAMLGILALRLSQRSHEDKGSTKEFR